MNSIALDTEDVADLLGIKGNKRQKRKAVYNILKQEWHNFGTYKLNNKIYCIKDRIISRVHEMSANN